MSWMIGFGFTVLGCAMWYFASFNLATNYGKEAWARAVQGFGIAFLFVPTSQLAYSYLPKNKNNKASSLTNLFRNQGGSFGIALMTTVLARRAQYHQSVLVTHVTNYNQTLGATIEGITNRFIDHGYSAADASVRAVAQVYAIVQQQANMGAFLDCFWILGLVAFIGPILAIFIRKFKQGGSAAAH
jgi:DHA2 family multidrug resistance protein